MNTIYKILEQIKNANYSSDYINSVLYDIYNVIKNKPKISTTKYNIEFGELITYNKINSVIDVIEDDLNTINESINANQNIENYRSIFDNIEINLATMFNTIAKQNKSIYTFIDPDNPYITAIEITPDMIDNTSVSENEAFIYTNGVFTNGLMSTNDSITIDFDIKLDTTKNLFEERLVNYSNNVLSIISTLQKKLPKIIKLIGNVPIKFNLYDTVTNIDKYIIFITISSKDVNKKIESIVLSIDKNATLFSTPQSYLIYENNEYSDRYDMIIFDISNSSTKIGLRCDNINCKENIPFIISRVENKEINALTGNIISESYNIEIKDITTDIDGINYTINNITNISNIYNEENNGNK